MRSVPRVFRALTVWWAILGGFSLSAAEPAATAEVVIVSVRGTVELSRTAQGQWEPAQAGGKLLPGQRLRTAENGAAMLRLANRCLLRLPGDTVYRVEEPPSGQATPSFQLEVGSAYLQSREPPGEIRFRTKLVAAAIRGTEVLLTVGADGATEVSVLDGKVDLTNEQGQLSIQTGELARAKAGAPLERAPLLNIGRRIQWALYYPGVLNPDDLSFTAGEREALKASLAAYRSGDLLGALRSIPTALAAPSAAQRVYLAALHLSLGQVDAAESGLAHDSVAAEPASARAADAMRRLLHLVRGDKEQTSVGTSTNEWLAIEWMVESVRRQMVSDLPGALAAARSAAAHSPEFGFAWARVAELEFGFARIPAAREALAKARSLSPQNAQAVALEGFLHSARGDYRAAETSFEQAVTLDGTLANAWLGRGLIRIRQGDLVGGRRDLQTASLLEPTRAILRSYLGKAFSAEGDGGRALHELALAQRHDPNDPTAWLYSALANWQQNLLNPAVRDLERSTELNDNRGVFRSRLLLDQDQAVRSANLAAIYRDAGMTDFATREASRAVSRDFANASAHLFLASTYSELRAARQADLRYETPTLNELLLANLLAPPGAGVFPGSISQQEYTRLFEQDRLSLFSATEYRSSGDWSQSVSQFGRRGEFSYAVDYLREAQQGQQPNGDSSRDYFSAQFKQRLSERDSLFVQAFYSEQRAGDLNSYYDPASANAGVRFKETLQPSVLAGWHREWAPGNHTLLLLGRIEDELAYANPAFSTLLLARNGVGAVFAVAKPAQPIASLNFNSDYALYTSELLQIFQRDRHTSILGARFQRAAFDTTSQLSASTATRIGDEAGLIPPFPPITFATPATAQASTTDFERLSLYAYQQYEVVENVRLIGGVTFDQTKVPDNHLFPPVSGTEHTDRHLSPKAGLVWTPGERTTARFGFARAVSGASFDQSFRIEPSEVAGFNQSYRSVIPDSVAGTTESARFESFGLSLEHKLPTQTYLAAAVGWLNSQTTRRVGAFDLTLGPATPGSTQEILDYTERTLVLSVNQLLGDYWHLGARYQLSDAELADDFPEIPATVSASAHTLRAGTLHQLHSYVGLALPQGFFGRAEAVWHSQSNRGFNAGATPGDDFWQANLHAGWRFLRRRGELQVSLLNLAGQDYRLNPLNLHSALPRERTLAISLKLSL